MRLPRRLRPGQDTFYHCTSRTVAGQFLFTKEECRVFSHRLWRVALFCQVEIGTYTCLSNHFHVVLKVPRKVILTDQKLLKLLEGYYGPKHAKTIQFTEALKEKDEPLLQRLRTSYLSRMGNLSVFFKELKEGFSKWFNRVHDRFGTLWAERFRSLIVDPLWLVNVLGYVDLNSVRAGIVGLPEEYPFSGYSEAIARDGPARKALSNFLPGANWEEKATAYRLLIYARGARASKSGQAVLDPVKAYEIFKSQGKLSAAEALLLKITAFTEGIAVGSTEFLEEISALEAANNRPRQTPGGFIVEGAAWENFNTLKKIKEAFQLAKTQPSSISIA